jgi:hypothetical protein
MQTAIVLVSVYDNVLIAAAHKFPRDRHKLDELRASTHHRNRLASGTTLRKMDATLC